MKFWKTISFSLCIWNVNVATTGSTRTHWLAQFFLAINYDGHLTVINLNFMLAEAKQQQVAASLVALILMAVIDCC